MSSQEDNPPTTSTTDEQIDSDFNQILGLIEAMHTQTPTTTTTTRNTNLINEDGFWVPGSSATRRASLLFDPRRLTFGDSIEDDSDTQETTIPLRRRAIPELVIRGVATMPSPPTQPSSPNEEKVSDENDDSTSDDEYDEKECCVCYKYKTDLHTIVLPNCGHIICQNCFFRWLRTSPTCPMCRDNLTSWERVSTDTIKDDIYEITRLYNRVSKSHNSLMHKCEDLRHTTSHLKRKNQRLRDENNNLKITNKDAMNAIIRRRKYTDYIRGYNAAIMTGNLMEDQTHLTTTDYKSGIRRGIIERDNFLNTIGVKPKEFLKVQPHLLSLIETNHQRNKTRRKFISIRNRSDRNNLNLNTLFQEDKDDY